jgi:hypothetical protein
MRFHFAFVALAVLAVTACASDPPTQAPVTVVTSPPKVVVIEKPAPPKVVYVEKPVLCREARATAKNRESAGSESAEPL